VKLLIANRGEIAVRIIRACREMGIATVAVYSEVDRLSPHVLMADSSFPIGAAPAAESYLDMDKLLAVAVESGADLLHPGYGFLAENANFAEKVVKAGLTWVGPPPSAMRLMGSKTESRKLAAAAGTPVIPGLMEPIGEVSELEAFVDEHGLPVLLKAVAGGGGKGMRVVAERKELAAAYERACSEGQAYFGDSRVYVERLIEAPRHVEVQVVGDHHGNAVSVGERECSIQRRHQKVVEECPSPVVSSKLRERLGDAALSIVRASGYHSLGTVEFLLDPRGKFFFLEMNTRLQVEHPVTEMITGVDIVREQLRIAAGEPLTIRQEDIVLRGHAIECRINAEDPKTFMPSPGLVTLWHSPGGPGIRVDSHVYSGYRVPPYYDSMIGKLIAHGTDRSNAIARMRNALSEIVVEGIKTNVPLHQEIFQHAAFRAGGTDIHYLEKRLGL
jgi:acetyl-CoA carboxylase biotin carboxylase subunit